MDLNKLYFDHQIAVMRADGAVSFAFGRDRRSDASLIAGRIGCVQRALGAAAAEGWETLAAARDPADLSKRPLSRGPLRSRENMAWART
jgi:hypothetical protein